MEEVDGVSDNTVLAAEAAKARQKRKISNGLTKL